MTAFVLKRLGQGVLLSLLVVSLVFSLVHLVPGDPVEVMLGEGAHQADVVALRERLGLDRPLAVQYRTYLLALARGDLGLSLSSGESVAALLGRHYLATLELAVAALGLALLISFPAGIFSALRPRGLVERAGRFYALAAVSVPSFWLGPMLILLFAVELDMFPVSGRDGLPSLALPALTLGLGLSGLLTRMMYTALRSEIGKPYVTTAQAKGRSYLAAVALHAAKNAMLPVLTLAGLQFGGLLTGAIITETIFSWPGLGRLLIQAVRLRDYPLIQGSVLLIALTYILVNLVTDLLYACFDPRTAPVVSSR